MKYMNTRMIELFNRNNRRLFWGFLFFILITYNCVNSQNNVSHCNPKDHLLTIGKYYDIGDTNNWIVYTELYSDIYSCTGQFYFKKNSADTSLSLEFTYNITNNDNEYIVNLYQKTYNDQEYKYYVNLKNKGDTSYFYKTPNQDTNEMIFIMGKYTYLYHNFEFDNEQRRYYEKNSDSLNKIRGNDIPQLLKN